MKYKWVIPMNRNSQIATENNVDENYKKNSERQKIIL